MTQQVYGMPSVGPIGRAYSKPYRRGGLKAPGGKHSGRSCGRTEGRCETLLPFTGKKAKEAGPKPAERATSFQKRAG
jgi:hypothetical protein